MHQLYEFAAGPLLWIAWAVFILGSLARIVFLVAITLDKNPVVINYFNPGYALRSILAWSIPFFPRNSRLHPFMTIVSFSFHICVVIVPVFALGHVVLWEESFGLNLWSLPDQAADILTLAVIFSLLFFLLRRIFLKEVRYVTFASDYALLGLIAAPFITGYAAYHGWFDPQLVITVHILSGELLLIAIPFTRLIHMVFAPFTRAYTASEFGAVRHVKDW